MNSHVKYGNRYNKNIVSKNAEPCPDPYKLRECWSRALSKLLEGAAGDIKAR